jgi:gas vesicle protein
MAAGKILLGVIAGAAAGALLGVLFAPDKGSATRQKLSKKGEDYVNGLKDKFSEFLDRVTEDVESIKEKGKEYANQGMDMMDKGKAKMEEVKNAAKGSATSGYSSGQKY